MKRSIFFCLTLCLATLLIASSVNAGPEPVASKDKAVATTAVAEPWSWTGFYIGGNVGYNWDHYEFSDYDTLVDVEAQLESLGEGPADFSPVIFFPSGADRDNQNVIGGVQVGFLKQFGHWVIGIEGDFNKTSTERRTSFEGFSADVSGDFSSETTFLSERRAEQDWNASARLILGYALERWLFYITGGGAFSDIEVRAEDTASTDFFEDVIDGGAPGQEVQIFLGTAFHSNRDRSDNVQCGWTAGAGAALMVNRLLTLGVEYRHSDYGDDNYNFAPHGNPILPGSTRIGLDSDQITLRVNFLLGNLFGKHY